MENISESKQFVFDELPVNIYEAIKKISEETSLDVLDFWQHREKRHKQGRLSVRAAIYDRIKELNGYVSPRDGGNLLYDMWEAEQKHESEPEPEMPMMSSSGLSILAIVFSVGAIVVACAAASSGC